MKVIKVNFLIIISSIFLLELLLPKVELKLKCEPDYKSKGDNYNCQPDPDDDSEYFYSYEFAHKAGEKEYYDRWKGVYWDADKFCYDAYDNTTRENGLVYSGFSDIEVFSEEDNTTRPSKYVNISHNETNLVNLHKQICTTKQHPQSNYNHGEYELLLKMDSYFGEEEKYLESPHHFYFTIENPSDENVTFALKVRNFVNTTEEMYANVSDWIINQDCITTTPSPPTTSPKPPTTTPTPVSPEETDNDNNTTSENDTDTDTEESKEAPTTVPKTTLKTTQPVVTHIPCEWYILNYTDVFWQEEYAIPEIFYLTENYTIEPHSSMKINLSLSFEKNTNETEGGYFVISDITGKSDEPFYWPEIVENNGKLEKLTNMEMILESDLEVGISTFALMRRKENIAQSYLSNKCNVDTNQGILNGKCEDGFVCNKAKNGTKCEQCKNFLCKECDKDGKCTKCFSISVEGQWNPEGGSQKYLDCDLDYIDITKVIINKGKPIQVPPAIHWRVTMDFWLWISDASVFSLDEQKTNMNIIYKDFMAITLIVTKEEELKIYATPIEWLFEYPTWDEDEEGKAHYYYKTHVKPNIASKDFRTFLKDRVGSYKNFIMEDSVENPTGKWIYVRFAFDLDSSKMYLNDLPETNLKVPQIYKGQTNMPFHMKKFYGINNMTYLYFQNFYHPLYNDIVKHKDLNITIYFRNLNIFREYIPQNIVTKYYNLHKFILKPIDFPQLMISIPFSGVKKKDPTLDERIFEMEGYNYYVRLENNGEVRDKFIDREVTKYELEFDTKTMDEKEDFKSIRPPRDFWRLNLIDEANKQPATCDFDNYINLLRNSTSDSYCFEDNKPFVCNEGPDDTRPYYLDIHKLQCQQFCEIGYMHPPRYNSYVHRQYCSHFCDTGSKQCPSDDYKYVDTYNNFLCSNNFFNLYYKCFNKDEALNNVDYGGIFFSKFLWTPTIYINLVDTYTEFAIDFWYYPDQRLRQVRYEEDSSYKPLVDPDKHENPTTEPNRIIFWSDCCKIIFGKKGSKPSMVSFYVGETENKGYITDATIDINNWSHFILTYYQKVDGTYTYYYTSRNYRYFTDGNEAYELTTPILWGAPSGVKLSEIIFCNLDTKVNYGSNIFQKGCKTAEWLDGFYRKLQIFNLKYSHKIPIYFADEYEDDQVNGMIKHRYIYGLNSVVDNHLIDLIGGRNGRVEWVYDPSALQNPDRTNYILYEANYSPETSLIGDGYYVSNYVHNNFTGEIDITSAYSGDDYAKLTQTTTYSLSCKEGYSLSFRKCKGEINNKTPKGTYFYKNPGVNMPERVSLNLDFDKIKNTPYFTIFFFIKLYGFVKDDSFPAEKEKLLIFHEVKDTEGNIIEEFFFGWTPDREQMQKLYFQYNGLKLYSYEKFREEQFGHWIPVSFAAFRENDRLFQLNMCHAAILYKDLPFDSTDDGFGSKNKYYPYIKFTQFSITNTWVGLLSDVRIYNRFVINAWGIVRHAFQTVTEASDDVPDSTISVLDLKSEDKEGCLKLTDILNKPASGYKIECVVDFNPHFHTGTCGVEAHTVWHPQGDGIYGFCSATCGTHGRALVRCLGGHFNRNAAWYYDDQSCETQSPVWKNWYPASSGNGKITCQVLYYIDYNRFKYVNQEGVYSPQDVWAIDFWFYTGTCHAVYKRTNYLDDELADGTQKAQNNNNFKEITLEWNYHIRIKIYTVKQTDDPSKVDYDYYVDCTPIIVLEHPDLDSPEIYSNNLGDMHYRWFYVTCGVNFQEKVFYQTNKNKFSSEIPFTSNLVTIPSEKTNFVLNEKSPSGYGFTFVKQLRLWHCYNCAHSFRNLDYSKSDFNFNAVYHNFDGENGGGAGPTQPFYDQAGNITNTYRMVQAADFPGYTIHYAPGGPVLCDETIYNYYSEPDNACQRHFNLARIPNEEDFYRDIPSSRNGRYSMDFWFFVENSAELSPGLNVYWENHMSITLLRDTSNKNTINAICFPQSYRDNVDGKGGQEIVDLYDNALNKDKYAFYQGSSIWNFVRCSVDQTRKRFFINDNLELDLEGEILYGTTRNYRPFRYFKINSYHKLRFQNAYHNPTRIFLRQLRCYREYMDYRLMDMKYLRCGKSGYSNYWWGTCNFWPITFCFDFGELEDPSWPCTTSIDCFRCISDSACGLYYHIFNEGSENSLSESAIRWRYLLLKAEDPYYPTFPDIYLPNFCAHGQAGGNKVACTGSTYTCRMQNSTAYFWPDKDNYFLDLNTLTLVQNCDKSCRPPDSYYKRNYCLMEKDTNNMINCPTGTTLGYGNGQYYENYECTPGYIQVYYECIEPSIVKYSAMYFSNWYSFPNTVFSAANKDEEMLDYKNWREESRLASYYIEIWMKFDMINYRDEITEIEHYLYAHPHQIIKDPIDQKYKYSNIIISQGSYYYTLTSMQNYEWNKIIIENTYDPDTKLFHIYFYLNYEFDNPELSILNLDSSIYKLHFRGFGFCDKTDSYCRVNGEPVYLRWGVAWYRNFRVWDADITSLELIQACEYGYTQLINAQKYYFPLTVDYIYRNTILDRIDPVNNMMKMNYWIFYQGQDYKAAFDDAMRENYSTDNFDKTFIEENNYISGITEDGTDYLISACANECKRCYSSSKVDCYECRLGYAIYGKQCKVRTGYFLKTPPDNSNYEEIEITTYKLEDPYFDIKVTNPLTITLYIKFFGIELSKVVEDKKRYPLVYFYKNELNSTNSTYIGYNYFEKTLIFVVNGNEIYSAKAKPYIGIWTHFGISIHRITAAGVNFPNMLNFMIDQKELIPVPDFNPTNEVVNINTFTIHTHPICYYSSFKVFSTFYFGPYGHVNAIASTRGNKLLYQVNLYGSSNANCLSDSELADSTLNIKILKPVCVSDYHPYEDTNNICSDNDHFMDVIYKTNPPCELCDSICITNCFNTESSECTCDYYEGLYWVKTDENYKSYECEKVDSINFAFFEKVTLYGLTVVTNDEMTMAFWLDIYEYLDNKFNQLDVIWNHHIAVIAKGNGLQGDDKNLIIECHGDYDISSSDPNIGQTIAYDTRLKFNRWNYVVCQADKFHKFIRLNAQENITYTPVTYSQKLLTTSLTIEDRTTNFNYGFSFVRELKLFSSFNFDFWDESLHNLQHSHFEYLLHSFNNRFSEERIADSKITDAVEGLVTKLTLKSDRIGYNYIINYKYLVICEEGYVYNNITNKCDIYDSQECAIPRTSEEKCLLCGSAKPYLKDNDTCYKDCSPDYYADEYLKQCRRCDYTCHTCFGKKYNNCLSCVGIYYYIESLHVCITNCQEYGLIISTTKNNTCEELQTVSHISVPVYLNNSYDYNPSNEDYVSKIVNRDIFTEIQGKVDESSAEIETEWIFNWNKTIELNKEYRYFKIDDIPKEDPIVGDHSTVGLAKVDNSFFKYGYKYVFDLNIYSRNGNFSTNHTHTYILMMNDYPLVGKINILPSKGYITNLFLMTINKCTDDVTEKTDLRYKFSYFKKKDNVIDGYTNTTEEEIVIQDWSSNSEVLYKFPELNPEEDNKYYIRGYCRDKWGLYYSEIQEVEVYDIPTNSRVDIPLEEALESIDLDEDLTPEQLSNRAEFLATTTVDFEKGVEILNRTNVTDFTRRGIWQQNLILYDPTSSPNDIYCNYRGNSYVEYYYLICDCNGYEGGMCQIDHPSFDKVIEIYEKLFTKVKTLQTINYNHYLINAVNLLMRSGAAFMPIENMDFMLESIEFINLYTNKFAEEMMEGENYETYFDIYNSLIEYGLSIVNKLKYQNFIAANSKNAENLYNSERFRNATLNKGQPATVQSYFNKVKVSLQNLLEFYATNRKELRFINRNINVYVALINENFGFNSYFNIEKKLYEPYMNFQRCLETTMIQSQGNPSYRIFMTAIIWKVSPYMSAQDLYWDTASPVITFKFIDYDKGEKIYLSDCGDADNQIQLYFPLNTYRLVERINRQRDYLSPENQYDMNDDIFCDPVYINKSGAVFNTTPEERIQQFWLGFNFSCQYYKVSPEDQEDISLTKETLDYHLYTKENYVQCLTNKLVQEAYGEFVVQYYILPSDFHVNSRFFYLKHYMLLFWKENYNKNQAFFYFIGVVALYLVLSLGYIYFEKNYAAQMGKLGSLKTEVAKINMPYREEYIFNNDLRLEEEIKGKLKDKKKPEMEEMNLDTNNLNVDIMADEISKYNKGYKNQENALGFNSKFYGIKDKKKTEVNSKFFPGEVDIRKKPDLDDEVSPERLEKMKRFYQVGFKGLDSTEKRRKEMKLTDDKKKIVIGKRDSLEDISEKDEDSINIHSNYYNKNVNDDEEDEKETRLNKKSKKKFEDKMNSYKDFVRNSEIDTESNLKSSRRETSSKKFFGHNPPPKHGSSGPVMSSLILSEKDQQKKARDNTAFFGGKLDEPQKNKRKERNIFQKDYDNIYKPTFKGPKVISENLGFYNNMDTIDFEQEMDNNENKNPPFFGKRFRKKKLRDDEDRGKGENPGLRVGFKYKNRQIDLDDDGDEYPKLEPNLTLEQRLEEFHATSVSFSGFLIKNLKSRYILITTFDRMSIIYERYQRAGNFAAQLSMFAFFNSIFFTADAEQVAYVTGDKNQILNFILYCFLSDVASCIVVHLPAYCFWINDKKFRKLYNTIREDGGINVLKETDDIINKGRLFWKILGIIIQIIYILGGFYFAFGFCATYYYQRTTFFLALICTMLFDFFIAEFAWEIFIALLYYFRDIGRVIVFFGTIFNKLRDIKHLIH